jgi:hypothetical protein
MKLLEDGMFDVLVDTYGRVEKIVLGFVEKYESDVERSLECIERDVGERDIEEWAVNLYGNGGSEKLDVCRKVCIGFVWSLVNTIRVNEDFSSQFREVISRTLGGGVKRILRVCVPLQRARSKVLGVSIDDWERVMSCLIKQDGWSF